MNGPKQGSQGVVMHHTSVKTQQLHCNTYYLLIYSWLALQPWH